MVSKTLLVRAVIDADKPPERPGFRVERFHLDSPKLIDPILMIDHFWMSHPTFPAHPHAGFSAVTYMLPDSEGGFVNRDSLGGRDLIHAGDLHWTHAGSGVVHEETPIENGQVSHGLQIFINLPEKFKETKAKYYHLRANEAPSFQRAGISVKVVTGKYEGLTSPVQTDWPIDLLDVNSKESSASFDMSLSSGQVLLALVLSGSIELDSVVYSSSKFVSLLSETGHRLSVNFEAQSHVIFFRSFPINEPIMMRGPFVASSSEKMADIMRRYQQGLFGGIT